MSALSIVELLAATAAFIVLAVASYFYAHREKKETTEHDSTYVVCEN